MGEKPAEPGRDGEVLGKKLEEGGFDKACVVLKDEDLFREWLKDTCGANAKQPRDCLVPSSVTMPFCVALWGDPNP
ncbi:Barrier-to-autointegration factor [Myotis brandtii]|uniref:Barrier-to-autointegration factor n=1 Tax=Myotis brandtii TaxID=109478 RepID=S7PV97_MYOBR|nr:Barrier-to-autointegration factor [Myotis brandtii]